MTDLKQRRFWQEFGLLVHTAREQENVTQASLGRVVSLSRPSIANIEAGRQCVSFYVGAKICARLNINPTDLFREHDRDVITI